MSVPQRAFFSISSPRLHCCSRSHPSFAPALLPLSRNLRWLFSSVRSRMWPGRSRENVALLWANASSLVVPRVLYISEKYYATYATLFTHTQTFAYTCSNEALNILCCSNQCALLKKHLHACRCVIHVYMLYLPVLQEWLLPIFYLEYLEGCPWKREHA